MGLRRCFSSTMSALLFIFSVLQMLCGIGFLIFGLMLQNPPKSSVALAMVIFSAVMMLTALFGMISSCYSRRACVVCYCVWGVVITVVQLGIVLACIINPTAIADKIAETCTYYEEESCSSLAKDRDRLLHYIEVGRWVFLGWVIAEFIFLAIAISLSTCCNRRKLRSKYSDLEADKDVEAARQRLQQVQMQNMELEQRLGKAPVDATADGGKGRKGGKAALAGQEQVPINGNSSSYPPAMGVPVQAQPNMYPPVQPAAVPPSDGGWGKGSSKGAW